MILKKGHFFSQEWCDRTQRAPSATPLRKSKAVVKLQYEFYLKKFQKVWSFALFGIARTNLILFFLIKNHTESFEISVLLSMSIHSWISFTKKQVIVRGKIINNICSIWFIESGVADSEINRNSIRKKGILLRINTTKRLLLFKMKYVLDGGS